MDDGLPQPSAADVTMLDLVFMPNLLFFQEFLLGASLNAPPNRAGSGSTHQRGDGYCLSQPDYISLGHKMQEKKQEFSIFYQE
jgi:hypothetical protein